MTPDREQPLTGLEIALQWGQLPAEHLQAALKALEPELRREHEFRIARLEAERQEAKDRRMHQLYLSGLIAGFVISVSMLGAAVVLGMNNQPWLAAMMAGPSLLTLVTMFVLRRSDTTSMKAAAKAKTNIASINLPPTQAPENPSSLV
ncbi:hypothetical protein [Microbispora amethystogenes]|uniref:DUF2335 domain-containing protein n=1 Tax=Microbispora amethystogenes TaxID=1427754 RepID=A0ABQ4FLF6_9ACTN|nr:hypothetical protein [Microbispora amethystogenes]GIH35649.1 hypothetical protein Mam01_58130 [Microbispora amethystogenes]